MNALQFQAINLTIRAHIELTRSSHDAGMLAITSSSPGQVMLLACWRLHGTRYIHVYTRKNSPELLEHTNWGCEVTEQAIAPS